MIVELLNVILLGFLVVTAFGIVRLRSLFAVVMLSGIYSLLSATIFVVLDAVDVSFTEAAVGAGITTVLFLSALALTGREERVPKKQIQWPPLIIVLITGGGLIYATLDPAMPHFGDPKAPVHHRTSPEYLADNVRQKGRQEPTKVGIPNIVTTALASYRGYDTLGEVVVIFTAGSAVLLLLGHVGRRRREDEDEDEAGETANSAGEAAGENGGPAA